MKKKVLLVIRDGWWYSEAQDHNAIWEWNTPFTDKLMEVYPNVLLEASGEAVGLPNGYMGNSEVGHLTIWSGRIVDESLTRIFESIKDWSFVKNSVLLSAISYCKENNSSLHLMGLLQTEWVHAHIEHLFIILDACKRHGFGDVKIHVFTDGRDSAVVDSVKHIQDLETKLSDLWFGKIVSLCGRYYAMDRDRRWDRTKLAYDCIADWNVMNVKKDLQNFDSAVVAIEAAYHNGETDEFLLPRVLKWYDWIKKKDTILFRNYRTDRTRQLTQAFIEPKFVWFDRDKKDVHFVAMTQYYDEMDADVLFEEETRKNTLWEVISHDWYRQLRISETEKYAHVTFFFNGQMDAPYLNEDRILIDSPKVATYDLSPEMSVYTLKDRLIKELNKNKYDLVVTNIVNGDMVWHTGVSAAIRKAVESVDICLRDIVAAGLENDYDILIFADHGNAEDQSLAWRTSHTTNPVPCIFVSKDRNVGLKKGRSLQDIAPTVLEIMWIVKPKEMTWESLLIV